MKARLMKAAAIAVPALVLAACTSTPDNAFEEDKPFELDNPVEDFTYSANGNTYRLQTKNDGLLRARITSVTVVEGTPFTGDVSEDPTVQNLIRDAFRAQGICPAGEHPGLLNFGYGYNQENDFWVARVRCSEKRQANVAV